MKLFSNIQPAVEAAAPTVQEFVMDKPFWNILSDLRLTQKDVELKGLRLKDHVKLGYLQEEDYAELRGISDTIKAYGTSEGLMACINENDQLARCLGIAIPEVNAINGQSVGIACVEAIAEKLECSCGMTCKFLKDLSGNVSAFVNAFMSNVECQKETLKVVNEAIIKSVKFVDAVKFNTAEICGYTQPVFMERIAAVEEVLAAIKDINSIEDAQKFIPALQKLGYVVEQTVEVREETPAEAKATEPEASSVMSAPVKESEKSEEELEGPVTESEIPATIEATDGCQKQEVAVLRWTPDGIANAAVAVITILSKTEEIASIGKRVESIIADTVADCDKEGEKDEAVRAKIDANRRLASFLSSVLFILGKATNEFVDQVVCMSSVLKKYEAEKEEDKNIVPASDVTVEKPLADKCSKAGFRFIPKTVAEAVPPMEVKPEEEGTQPAVAPAPEQKEVEQPKPAQAEPDPAMTVEPKEEGLPGKPADLPEPQGEKVQPEVKVDEPAKAEGGFVEDPIVSTPATPEAQPVLPAPATTPEIVPPADPVPPAEPTAPAEPAQAPVVEDPVVAPTAPVQDNVNSEEEPKAVPAPAEPVEPPKGSEPVELDPALNKPVTDPVPEEKIVPAGEEKPAEQVKELQEPEKTNPNAAEAKAKGKLWF